MEEDSRQGLSTLIPAPQRCAPLGPCIIQPPEVIIAVLAELCSRQGWLQWGRRAACHVSPSTVTPHQTPFPASSPNLHPLARSCRSLTLIQSEAPAARVHSLAGEISGGETGGGGGNCFLQLEPCAKYSGGGWWDPPVCSLRRLGAIRTSERCANSVRSSAVPSSWLAAARL